MNARVLPRLNVMALFALVLLTACAPAVPAATRATTLPPAQALDLEPCTLSGDIAARCGTLSVYENRAAGSGRKIDLRVAVVKAAGPHTEPDPIFWLAGGPGTPATTDAYRIVPALAPALQKRDLVLVDQRGTGGSHDMMCTSHSLFMETDAASRAALAADVKACLAGLDGDPRAYTTAWAVDDVDDVRQALGYDLINLVGQSYGSTAVQVYLLRHGEHVRTAAMGGVTLLDVPVFERFPRSSQRALDALFDRCAADKECGRAFPDLRADFAAIAARLDRGPIVVPDPAGGTPITFTRDLLSGWTHNLLFATDTAVRLPAMIHAAASGDWTPFTQLHASARAESDGLQYMSVMAYTIMCHEPWAQLRRAETERLSEGAYATYEQVRLFTLPDEVCSAMPVPQPEALYGPVTRSEVPILLLSSGADPQDPPENVAGASDLWPNSLALVAPGQGHDQNLSGWICHFSLIAALIEAGSVQGLDTACLQQVELPSFALGTEGTAEP